MFNFGQHFLYSSDHLVCSVVGIYKFNAKKSEFSGVNSHPAILLRKGKNYIVPATVQYTLQTSKWLTELPSADKMYNFPTTAIFCKKLSLKSAYIKIATNRYKNP